MLIIIKWINEDIAVETCTLETWGQILRETVKELNVGATWVAHSVKHQTLAQVIISWFVGLSPTSGSVLTAQDMEPTSDSVSPSLSPPPLLTLCLSLSLSQKLINITQKFFKKH